MPHVPRTDWFPRPRLDPMESWVDGLQVVLMTIDFEFRRRHQVLVVTLDDVRRAHTVTRFRDAVEPFAVVDAVAHAVESAMVEVETSALLVASMRPDGGVGVDDLGYWHAIDALCDEVDIELVEWYVVGGRGVDLPRELCGVRSRWSRP